MFDSECQKVNIGELLWSENSRAVDQAFVEKGYVIRPESVIGSGNLFGQEFKRFRNLHRFWISKQRNDAHKSILCERT